MFHGRPYLYLVVGLLVESSAYAHTPGLSTSDFALLPDATVEASLVLAGREAFAWGPLDTDHDGLISQEEVDRARPDLSRLVSEGVDVSADGDPCSPRFENATVTETDGVQLTAHYLCPRVPSSLTVTLYFLSELGESHRDVVRLIAGGAQAQKVLTSTQRALSIAVPSELRTSAAPTRPLGVWIAAGALLLAAALGLWRRRRN